MTMAYVDTGISFRDRRPLEFNVAHRVDGRVPREVDRVPIWVGWVAITAIFTGIVSFVWFLITGGIMPIALVTLSCILWWIAVIWTRRHVLGPPTEHWKPIG